MPSATSTIRDVAVTAASLFAVYTMYLAQRGHFAAAPAAAASAAYQPSATTGRNAPPSSCGAPHTGGHGAPPRTAPSPAATRLFYDQGSVRQRRPDRSLLVYEETEFPFGMVADLDRGSRHPDKLEWRSYLKRGVLRRGPSASAGASSESGHPTSREQANFTLEWVETVALFSKTARSNRSMELSELVRYNHLLLAICDITGIVWKILLPEGGAPDQAAAGLGGGAGGGEGGRVGECFQRYAIADGDGEKAKPFKGEWATVKDGLLWVCVIVCVCMRVHACVWPCMFSLY